jgi:hypothetical protein
VLGLREVPVKSSVPADRFLKPLVVLLIVLWCGPEVFAVIELTTLLELLGATLFLLAFTASFKMLALSVLDWLRRALLPSEYTADQNAVAWYGGGWVGSHRGQRRRVVRPLLHAVRDPLQGAR